MGSGGSANAGVAAFAEFPNGSGQSFGCSSNCCGGFFFFFFFLGKCFRKGMLVCSQIHIKI